MNHKSHPEAGLDPSVVSATVGVPNSLGPAELLIHYGTEEQKEQYLPRLADGRRVPCFGADRTVRGLRRHLDPDYGIVCEGRVERRQRCWASASPSTSAYITLAPVATLIGVAFRMYDPDGLLGDTRDIGISLALVRATPGAGVGRRHFPLNSPFQNGPIRNKDVFIPLSPTDRRRGLRPAGLAHADGMPVDRALDHLPSTASGGFDGRGGGRRLRASASSSACRSGRFEGVGEALARIGGNAYAYAARCPRRPRGGGPRREPAVPSTIAKYHCTEMGRKVSLDIMDPRRQGHHPRPAQLRRALVPGRADRDHGRGRGTS